MITEIPSADDFRAAGLNHIYLAWQIAMRAVEDYENVEELTYDWSVSEKMAGAAEYWSKSQPVLANSYGLVQQSMEMALKGLIAAISPYLLIARDPKDWPSGVDSKAVPFSDFRTLDAADLIKVHNTFATTPLDQSFRAFWDGVRRDRNKLMHSLSAKTFDPALLIRTILTAVEALFSDVRWPQRLLAMESEDKYVAYGLGQDNDHNAVMAQTNRAIQYLTPAENKRFFGFDPKRRSYVCPLCWERANHDWQDEWPALAQLSSKRPGSTKIICIVCNEGTEVDRTTCTNGKCKSNVIYADMCLSCLRDQNSPYGFYSGLESDERRIDWQYRFEFKGTSQSEIAENHFSIREMAVEHARRAMEAPHLKIWLSVTVRHMRFGFGGEDLGTWNREAVGLAWHPIGEREDSSPNRG